MTEGWKILPKEQQKKIQASIDASSLKYEQIKIANKVKADKRKIFRASYHEGNEFLKKECKKDDILFNTFDIDKMFYISYILIPGESTSFDKNVTRCKIGYCIKAPVDSFVKHIATGLCGYNIKHHNAYTITTEVPRVMLKGAYPKVYEAIDCILKAKILLFGPEIPQRLINHIYKQVSVETTTKTTTATTRTVIELRDKAKAALDINDFTNALKYSEEMLTLTNATKEDFTTNRTLLKYAEEMSRIK